MEWFKHDSNANLDEKLQEVLLDYGLEGYGLYWYCIELIVGKVTQENITFELKHDARIIARNTGSTVTKVEEMMKRFVEIGLFESNDGAITCLKVARRLMTSATSNPKMRNMIQDIKKSHEGSLRIISDQSEQSSSCRRHDGIMQEEKRIEENRIEEREEIKPTASGAICLALKKHQILDVNPSHPKLLALIEAGASIEEFEGAAAEVSVKKFAYVMATVEGRRKDAKNLKLVKGKIEPKENLAWRNDDNQIFKKAKELGIATQGKGRFELLAKIDEKREQSKI